MIPLPLGDRRPWKWLAQDRAVVGMLLLIALGSVRIILTYDVFSHTLDEPGHIAAGMEWLDRGTYHLEHQHPPLARAMTALGPYLAGGRSLGVAEMPQEGFLILIAGDHYDRTLALARLGILPFFWVGSGVVFAWARRYFGSAVGLMAVLLFTHLPGILAHSGLATTDMAMTALVGATLYAVFVWLESPGTRSSAAAGGCFGLAVLSKFAALVFVPAALVATLVWYVVGERPPIRALVSFSRARWRQVVFATAVAVLVIWAGYRFSVGEVSGAGLKLPAPELYSGVAELIAHNRAGHQSYLLGRHERFGWWYYFPVALAVKTPLAFLILALGGAVSAVRRRTPARWPLACAIGILLSAMTSRIDIGTRHVLAVYIGLSIVAAVFVVERLREWPRRPWRAGLVAGLLVWLVVSVAASQPDYLAYFNLTAGDEPEKILADSDLDWGQDVKRLAKRLRELGASEVALMPRGLAGPHVDTWLSQLSMMGLPPVRPLDGVTPSTGWNAVFISALKVHPEWLVESGAPRPPELWPERIRPRERVGKSVLLYYFPPAPAR